MDAEDEQILGITGNYGGLNLPVDLNAPEFRPRIQLEGEAVPEAEVARLNALVNGERLPNVHGGAQHRRRRRRRAV